jgi:hypothetical protein
MRAFALIAGLVILAAAGDAPARPVGGEDAPLPKQPVTATVEKFVTHKNKVYMLTECDMPGVYKKWTCSLSDDDVKKFKAKLKEAENQKRALKVTYSFTTPTEKYEGRWVLPLTKIDVAE